MLDSISEFLTPENVRRTLDVLKWTFYLAVVALLFRAAFHFAPYRVGHRVRLMLFPLLFAAGALATLVHQAGWQITGFVHKEFMTFMERYNPRPNNAAHKLIRGSILDRNGEPLAFTRTDGSGVRVYPYDMAAVHAVGYRDPKEGLTGIERAADATLSGYRDISWEVLGETVRTALNETRLIGTNVTLTIDARLQMRACSLLRGRPGAAVALDPKTGEVLLLCSSPAFDPNHIDHRLHLNSPFVNRAIAGTYPAGSTFKTVIAALMVDCGVPLRLDCPAAGYRPPGAQKEIHDHEFFSWQKRGQVWPGFGTLDLDTALAKSSNTYFAHGGVLCGPGPFNALMDRLRINESVVLYSNATSRLESKPGSVPRLGRGKLDLQELAQRSIGQGTLLVTPLHMAMIVSAIANGGTMMAPHMAADAPPEVLSRPFSPGTAARVAAAMRGVVRQGTGRNIDLPGREVCGKTGTAQNPHGDDHAWFVCFAPASDPQIAVAVIVEKAGFGSAHALPVAKGILEEFFRDREADAAARNAAAPPPPAL